MFYLLLTTLLIHDNCLRISIGFDVMPITISMYRAVVGE